MNGTKNVSLIKAHDAKCDEFYTQLNDICNELRHYKELLRGKTIFCNCDDPLESNFFKYFVLSFNALGIKKLLTTGYSNSYIAACDLSCIGVDGLSSGDKGPYAIEINQVDDQNISDVVDPYSIENLLKIPVNKVRALKGNHSYAPGDFRSQESIALLQQADIVITNPPFSLFREYVAQLINFNKQFLIVGSKNAITYKEIFKLIQKGALWLGHGFANGNAFFSTPKHSDREFASGVYDEKSGLVKFRNVSWFTNLPNKKRQETLNLYKDYSPSEFPHYDNYDAIEVSKIAHIPRNYSGAMGVPITFLDSHNPGQFELLGIMDSNNDSGLKTKVYSKEDAPNHGVLNRRGTLMINGQYKLTYVRLLIRRR